MAGGSGKGAELIRENDEAGQAVLGHGPENLPPGVARCVGACGLELAAYGAIRPMGGMFGAGSKRRRKTAAGGFVVMLLPARTDTRWFHDYIYHKAEVRFIRGRLKFGGCKNSAPFPSMVVIFD